MTIQEFIQITGFNDRDSFTLNKMYNGIIKTKEQWIKELKNDFVFVIRVEEQNSKKDNKESKK